MINQEKIKEAVRLLLEGMGEDIDREGLIETPDRVARMYEELYGGIDEDAGIHHLEVVYYPFWCYRSLTGNDT